MRPLVRGASPTAARASVDLPEPDSPTRPTTSPSGIVRLTPSTAVVAVRPAPKRTVTSSKRSSLIRAPPLSRWSRCRCATCGMPSGSGSPARQQATRLPPSSVARCGSTARHCASASGHRAAYAHPSGSCAGSTGRPAIVASGRWRCVSMSGTAASSARVYGCFAAVARSAAGRSSTMRPAYITSTRSQTSATTETSWLIRSRATSSSLADRLQQVEHLLLHGDVEGRRRLVGDDERRSAHEAHADHRALAHAAGELVGVLLRALCGIGDPHGVEAIDGARERLPCATCPGARWRPRRAARPCAWWG